MSKGKQLRDLMTSDGMVLAPGAYDGLTAKLVAQAEFSAVYMTGAGTSCSHGYPDYGLITMSEMVANAGRMADAVNQPVMPTTGMATNSILFARFRSSRRQVSQEFIWKIRHSQNVVAIWKTKN